MRKDYVALATILLRMAREPAAMVGSSDIRRQDETSRNAFRTITGRIVKNRDFLFLAEEGSMRTYLLADANHLRIYEGKKVRISGALESPHVFVVRTIDEVD